MAIAVDSVNDKIYVADFGQETAVTLPTMLLSSCRLAVSQRSMEPRMSVSDSQLMCTDLHNSRK
jgi:hypothetical protein